MRHRSGCDLAFDVIAGAASMPRPGAQVTLTLRSEAVSLLIGMAPEPSSTSVMPMDDDAIP